MEMMILDGDDGYKGLISVVEFIDNVILHVH